MRAAAGRQLTITQQLLKHLPAVVPRLSQLHAGLPAEGLQQGGHRGGQHLFRRLLLPALNGALVMDVFGPGERQPDIQIRQIPCSPQLRSSSLRVTRSVDAAGETRHSARMR